MKLTENLKTLSIDNTGDKIIININGINLDTSALEHLKIDMYHGVCSIETVYSNWFKLSRER